MNIIKNSVTVLLITVLSQATLSQNKEFEGRIVYKVSIESKVPGVEGKTWQTVMALADKGTYYVKQGNYKLVYGLNEQYFISSMQKVFVKFKGIDTLYYMDYASDTATILNVSKAGAGKTVNGYPCKLITIKTAGDEKKYYYAPSLYLNPEYDKNNTIGQLNIVSKETSSIWLESVLNNNSYTVTHTCTQLVQEEINTSEFELPALPQKKFIPEELFQPATFKRTGGWAKYLSSNVDASLGAKYVKIPRGENEAKQTVLVRFMVNERGAVVNAEVTNKKEVHSKLAEEALRVVTGSPPWTPATIYGQRTIYWQIQPVTFQATK